MYVYVDPEDDFGRGEVKYTHVDPFRVYVDPAARDRYFRVRDSCAARNWEKRAADTRNDGQW